MFFILQCLLHVSCLHCIQQLNCINIPVLNMLKLDAPYMHVSNIDSDSDSLLYKTGHQPTVQILHNNKYIMPSTVLIN